MLERQRRQVGSRDRRDPLNSLTRPSSLRVRFATTGNCRSVPVASNGRRSGFQSPASSRGMARTDREFRPSFSYYGRLPIPAGGAAVFEKHSSNLGRTANRPTSGIGFQDDRNVSKRHPEEAASRRRDDVRTPGDVGDGPLPPALDGPDDPRRLVRRLDPASLRPWARPPS